MAKYASGNQERLRVGFTNNNENDTSLRVVGKVGIGTTVFDASSSLDVRGDANISGTLTANNVSVSSGTANLNELSVSGVSTFTGASDFNGDIDVDGHTELDDVHVSGVSTFTGAIDANGDLDVDGHTELDNLNVSGISTFTGAIDANGDLDVDGHTELDDVHVSGVSTFTDNINANGNLDVDGHTELDNLNVSGVSTFTGTIDASGLDVTGVVTATDFHTGIEGSSIRITSNTISGPAEMFIDPAAVGDNTGAVRIKGDLFVDGTQTIINSSTIELADFVVGIATTSTSDLLSDGAGIEIGPDNTFKYYYNGGTNPSLKSSESLNVASGKAYQIDQTEVLNATTLGTGVTNSSLTSVGNLTSLTVDGRIVGAATSNVIPFLYNTLSDLPDASTYHGAFAHVHGTGAAYYAHAGNWLELVNKDTNGNVVLSGDLDVDGHTELDNLNVSGISTFTGAIDANGDLDVDGHTELDNLNVSGVSTFTGTIDANGGLDVSGVSTFQGNVNLGDDDKLIFGDDDDLEIFHNSSNGNTIIQETTGGNLVIKGSNLFLQSLSNETFFKGDADGAVELYYDNSKKFETTGIGVSIYDDLNVGTGVTIYGNSGIVSATAFYGDGSNLLNTGATLSAATGAQRLVLTGLTSGTMVNAATDADLTFNATTNTLDTSNLSVGNNLSVTGLSTFTGTVEFDGNVRIDGTLSASGSVGTNGQYLQSTGVGVSWATFPTLRTTQTNTASAGQTTFNFSYNVNFLDVFVNGVKLTSAEYTATNGSQIILDTPAFAGEVIEFHSYNTTSYGSGGGGGGGAAILNDLSDVTINTPSGDQLLQYDNSTSRWINVSALSVVGTANLNDLSGVTINTPADDELLQYNSSTSQWENTSVATAVGTANLNDLSGVTISAVADDQLLQYNSSTSQWENISAATVVGAASSFATKSATATTATAGQTTFNGTYTVGFVDVYLNGVKLSEDQYTATTGTNIVLDEGASENDIVEVVGLTANVPGSGGGGGGGGGISLTDLSVTTNSAGSAALSYNDSNGVFSYTPPDLSSYLTAESDTLDSITGRGSTTTNDVSVGIITATEFVKSSNSGGFLKADGTEDTSTYLTAESDTLATVTGRGSSTNTDLTFGGKLNVTGVSTFSDDVNIGTGATVAFFDISSGNVGISSTQPTAKLDVDGTLNVSGISTLQYGLEIGGSFSGSDGISIKAPGSGTRQVLKLFGGGATDGKVVIQGHGPNHNNLVANALGTTELWWAGNTDAAKKLETTGYGVSVYGDARISGILTVGQSSVTIDGTTNEVVVGTGVTIQGNTGIVSATEVAANSLQFSKNNATVAGTSGTTGQFKQIGGAPFYYDGTAWREFALLEGTPVTTAGDTDWDNVMFRMDFEESSISSVTNLKNGRSYDSIISSIDLVSSPGMTNFGKSLRFVLNHSGLYWKQDPDNIGNTTLYDFEGAWTIELWVHFTSLPTNAQNGAAQDSMILVCQNDTSGSLKDWVFGLMYNDSGTPGTASDNYSFYWYNGQFPVNTAGTPGNINSPFVLDNTTGSTLLNTWNHVALVRRQSNSEIEFYLNGSKSSNTVIDSYISNGDDRYNFIRFGNLLAGTVPYQKRFYGNMDDVRITTDERYTGNSFTVPTSPHPTTGTTSTVYTPPNSKEGEITLGASPTWTGTTGVGVTQVASGQYRLTFSSAYSSTTAYTVNANMMDYDPATSIVGVGVSRVNNQNCDFYVRRLSDDSAVDTGSLAVSVYKK